MSRILQTDKRTGIVYVYGSKWSPTELPKPLLPVHRHIDCSAA